MRRAAGRAVIVAIALALSGCATMTVGSHIESGLDVTIPHIRLGAGRRLADK
jgi:hypothetical protein